MVLSGQNTVACWSRRRRATPGIGTVGGPDRARPAGRLRGAPGVPAPRLPSYDLSNERPTRSESDVYQGDASCRGSSHDELPHELHAHRRVAVWQGAVLPFQSPAYGMLSLSSLILVLSPSFSWPTLTSRHILAEPSPSTCGRDSGGGSPISPRPGGA